MTTRKTTTRARAIAEDLAEQARSNAAKDNGCEHRRVTRSGPRCFTCDRCGVTLVPAGQSADRTLAVIEQECEAILRSHPEFETTDDWVTVNDPARIYEDGKCWDRDMEQEDAEREMARSIARRILKIARRTGPAETPEGKPPWAPEGDRPEDFEEGSRDLKAAEEYVTRTDGPPPKRGTQYGRLRTARRGLLRASFLQGWHEANVARDHDDEQGL